MNELESTLHAALDAAAGILMRYYGRLDRVDVKAELDFVTVADREAENAIKAVIRSHFPHHAILAEESGENAGNAGNETRWVVDPLDGTTNFAHTFPLFATSIAVEHAGVTILGGVNNPFSSERFFARRGGGATRNGETLRVSNVPHLTDALLVTGFPYDRRARVDHYLAYWKAFLGRAHGVLRLGSAALDLCSVACGRLDGFWEEHLKPWDTAAGALLLEEAGGRLTAFDGGVFSPYGSTILASNGAIHDEFLAAIAAVAAIESS